VAAEIVEAGEEAPLHGKFRDALKSAFIRRGLLSLQAAATLNGAARRQIRSMVGGVTALGVAPAAAAPGWMAIPALSFGLKSANLLVQSASAGRQMSVTASSLQLGPAEPRSAHSAALAYTEDLFQRGHVDVGKHADPRSGTHNPFSFKTHAVVEQNGALLLKRRTFNCGFCE
jgi:hypothetical protein